MPGRLPTNFRSGNLAEHLGLLLLKGVAAVADVPRTEDIGLDAVATLLRRDADGNCYAEDSFVVQFKSDSDTSMAYRAYQLSWFLAQSQPMFIGLVSRKDAVFLFTPLYMQIRQCWHCMPTRLQCFFARPRALFHGLEDRQIPRPFGSVRHYFRGRLPKWMTRRG